MSDTVSSTTHEKAHLGKPRAAKPRVLASFCGAGRKNTKDPKIAGPPNDGRYLVV